MADFLTDWEKPFHRWKEEREANPGPVPEGLDLSTPNGLREWLRHPSNWRKTYLFIVGWDGLEPWISSNYAWKMAPGCEKHGDSLLAAILYERRIRRHRPRPDDDVERELATETMEEYDAQDAD